MRKTIILAIFISLFLTTGAAIPALARDMVMLPGYQPSHHYGKYWRGHEHRWQAPGPFRGTRAYAYRYYGWPGYGPDRSAFGSTLSRGEAKKLVQWMIRCDPNLKVGNILKVNEGYEVAVVTRTGKRVVDTLLVEKDTAYIYPIYKPVGE